MLGSGGPRGFTHIGVMKVLEESGIEYEDGDESLPLAVRAAQFSLHRNFSIDTLSKQLAV